MRKYVITFLFALLMAASVLLFLLPADEESITSENREVAAFPNITKETLVSGEFASGFDAYVNDNIGFRGALMNISRRIQSYFGYTPELVGKVVSTTSDIGIGETLEGSLVIIDGRIMEMFSKKPDVETKYAEALNSIREGLPENIPMYSMIVPTQLEFAEPMFANAQDSQKSCIDNIDDMLSDGIKAVNVYDRLKESSEAGEDLYFKTDHHWNMNGSYCGYTSFIEESGGTPYSRSLYTVKERGEFFGSLYQKANTELDESDKDKLFYYDTVSGLDISIVMKRMENGKVIEYGTNATVFDETKSDYTFFMGGDNPYVEITNNSMAEGKTLMIIKDSYANIMIPWLVNNYKKIIVIDPRSYEGNFYEDAESGGVNEVLVVNYVFTTTFADYCGMLADLSVINN